MPQKQRLDLLLLERNLVTSRNKGAAMIMAAEVLVDGQVVDKPGMKVSIESIIELKDKPRYVGRGGLKMEGALEAFDIEVSGKICADVGASTGGFTDCLLQNGAERVYAIDVARGIIDYRLRTDNRVVLLENTNARYLETLAETIAIVVIDVSFISLKLILPAVKSWLDKQADVVALIKPQFEAGKNDVGKGGIVRDKTVHLRVLNSIVDFAVSEGFRCNDLIRSPITGQKGNVEYLAWLSYDVHETTAQSYVDYKKLVSIVD